MIINSIAASMYIKLYQCHPPTSSLPVYEPSWHPSLRSKLFPPRTQFSNLRAKDGAMVCKSMMTLGQESIQANNTHRFCGPLLLHVQPTKKQQPNHQLNKTIYSRLCVFYNGVMWSSAMVSQSTSTWATTEQFSTNPGIISSSGWLLLIFQWNFPIRDQGFDLYSNVTMKCLMTQKLLNAATSLPARSKTRSPFLEVAQRSSETQFRNITKNSFISS